MNGLLGWEVGDTFSRNSLKPGIEPPLSAIPRVPSKSLAKTKSINVRSVVYTYRNLSKF